MTTQPIKRATWIEATEVIGVAFFFILVYLHGLALRELLTGKTAYALSFAGALLGYIGADFLSGVVHWFCDTFFEEDTPILGPMIIYPFREHHRDPLLMTRHGFFERNGNNCLAAIPVLIASFWDFQLLTGGALVLWKSFLIFLCLATLLTNQFHAWAHAERVPDSIRKLQNLRLILSPEGHSHHHCGKHDRGFCVTTGWLNPLIDRLGLFRASKRILMALGVPVGKDSASS